MHLMALSGAVALASAFVISLSAHASSALAWTNSLMEVTNAVDLSSLDDSDLLPDLVGNIDYMLVRVANSGSARVLSHDFGSAPLALISDAAITVFGVDIARASPTGYLSPETCITTAYSCSTGQQAAWR